MERLALFNDGDEYPAWSPDGGMVAFYRKPDVYVANADGSAPRRLTEGWDPSWSPDGNWIAFTSRKTTKWVSEVFIIRKDGKFERQITDTRRPNPDKTVGNWYPHWL
ncbi:MAG: DPP IV N-terminal domain-containing protein, partial [Chlorobi bacterium]|nr:DPP IV N-terminal domain-containing protein [Chlorobiota bacterium]